MRCRLADTSFCAVVPGAHGQETVIGRIRHEFNVCTHRVPAAARARELVLELKCRRGMSTTPIGSSTSGLSLEGLIKQLVDKVDTNKDGQISSNEFGSFLTSLLGAVDGQSGTGNGAKLLAKAADSAGGTTVAVEADPSTWTANNAPYGVTYAGFSPQDHRDLTLADLGVPGKAEKYAAYSYMVANKIQPTGEWAQGVADALNAKYNTTVFKAIDGETLGFGNEYIHSAANGYGMAAGTYDRSATGEFFWGWV